MGCRFEGSDRSNCQYPSAMDSSDRSSCCRCLQIPDICQNPKDAIASRLTPRAMKMGSASGCRARAPFHFVGLTLSTRTLLINQPRLALVSLPLTSCSCSSLLLLLLLFSLVSHCPRLVSPRVYCCRWRRMDYSVPRVPVGWEQYVPRPAVRHVHSGNKPLEPGTAVWGNMNGINGAKASVGRQQSVVLVRASFLCLRMVWDWGRSRVQGTSVRVTLGRRGQCAYCHGPVRARCRCGARCVSLFQIRQVRLNESSHAHAPGIAPCSPPFPITWREVYIHPHSSTPSTLPSPNPSHQLQPTDHLATPLPTTPPHHHTTTTMKFSVVSALVGAAFVGFASAQK